MASSLEIGVSSASAQSSGAMILLGDQPGITAEIINQMLGVFQGDDKSIVRAAVNGRQTTPVIFPADLFQELTRGTGDFGGRFVVDRNKERVVLIEMGSRYDDSDLDTLEDLEKMALKLRSRHSQL
jgi:molybdenum cofactor cytidylyltransferase